MTEKINTNGFRPTDMTGNTRRPEATEATGTSGSSSGSVSSTGDTVNVSQSSVLLSNLQQTVSALPVVDAGRVEVLKHTISSGAYEVNAGSVADSMMRLERELS